MVNPTEELRKLDLKHIWHPYTDMEALKSTSFPVIERAEGVFLHTTDGRKLYDGIASWWCVNLGHSHPRLIEAIKTQAEKLQHCILGGMSHPSIIKLSAALAEITPGDLNHFFYAGDGCCAVEASLKTAVQYWKNRGVQGRTKFISLEEGYHGDSLGAVGVGYVPRFHKHFKPLLPPAYRAASPYCAECPFGQKAGECNTRCFSSMEKLIRNHHKETAAVILEPLCQGAAGIRIYPPEYLVKLRTLCDEFNLLLIFDEIAVGFGRTGAMFASGLAGVTPDIMTIGKGLTNGYLPMSAMAVNDRVYSAFLNHEHGDPTLYHGHTFTGNPITAALGLEVVNIYKKETVLNGLPPLIKLMKKGILQLGEALAGSTALSCGLIGVVFLNNKAGGAIRAKKITAAALEAGLFVRPLGNSLYLWPPLVTTERELGEMFDILIEASKETDRKP